MTSDTLEKTGEKAKCATTPKGRNLRHAAEIPPKRETAFTVICQFDMQAIIGIPHPSVQNKLLRDKFGKLVQRTWEKTSVGIKRMEL